MTKRTLIICADNMEASRLFHELLHEPCSTQGYIQRREVVQVINGKSESTLFKTLKQLNNLDGYRFDKITITSASWGTSSLSDLHRALEMKNMLTLHASKEEPL